LFSPARGEKRVKKNTPSPLPSPAGWRGKEKEDEKILTSPHPTLSRKVERDRKKEKLCKDLNEFLT
jgi:hypothetical protein